VVTATRAPADERRIWTALADVPDPEIPVLSVVDLGVIRSVESTPESIRIELLPTFVGCPAIEAMREAIAAALAPLADEVRVDVSYAEPWTSDRITQRGRERLRASGFAPPGPAAASGPIALDPAVPCPYCGSRRTRLENVFGPTQCRSIRYCTSCRQPFEAFKEV
jgi:ring-1,2-phenylacetyl-CoA epoxidase subunit PaaD